MSLPIEEKKYTYLDYLQWPEGERVEIIDGEVHAMSPAPGRIHQEILGRVFNDISAYLRGKSCRVYIAPFDVRLPKGNEADEQTDTVVQPDLSVICETSKLDDHGCKGAPDLVVEVIAPGSLKYDLTVKKRLYERAGVREYWMVYPLERIVMVYKLEDSGQYDDGEAYGKNDKVAVGILTEFELDLSQVFEG